MNRKELERAWPAAEPSPGFSDRVLDRLQRGPAAPDAVSSEPVRRRASGLRWRPARPLRWLAFPALALALAAGGVFVLESKRSSVEGDVIAAEPRVVSIGERAVAELSSGARVRWSVDDRHREVLQDRGEVTYRVEPGGRFEVQTPYGRVAVLGTVFRVVVADRDNPTGGEPMKKRWAIAGAGASLGALLFVSVERGSVRISTAEHTLEVGAGEAGSVGLDGIPRRETAAPHAAAAEPNVAAEAERQRLRRVADAVRRHAAKRREAARAAKAVPDPSLASPTAPSEPAPPPVEFGLFRRDPPSNGTPEEERRRDYIRRTVREQYFPVARDCYAELLARQPTAGGKVTLEFVIVGDGDAGVVDHVALRDDGEDSIEDPEFRLCMTESMYTAVFEPPPPGADETTVVYPIVLAPE